MGYDELELTSRTCAICGLPEVNRRNPLVEGGFYEDTFWHHGCNNSPAGRAWQEQRCAADPTYQRYLDLITQRLPVTCPHCGAAMELWPKGRGMGGDAWDVNCTACHRTGRKSLSAYGSSSDGYKAITTVGEDFVHSRHLDQTDNRVREIALAYDHYVDAEPCPCGGRFSLAAKVRCLRCDQVLIDSYFHWAVEPLTEQRRKRLTELFPEASVPEDWEDAAGWEQYYAAFSPTGADYEAENLGSFGGDRLPGLIHDLREKGRTSLWLPGCGFSYLPRLLAEFGFSVHATDVSESAIRFQTGSNKGILRLKEQIAAAGETPPQSPGPFGAAIHDFRTPYLQAAFDAILNIRAFEDFPRESMGRIAASHFAALRSGGHAFFDLMNVHEGHRRDQIEWCLAGAGFFVPLIDFDRVLRRELAATGIPHVFVNGRPVIRRIGAYLDDQKRRRDTHVLHRIFVEFESQRETEYEADLHRVGPDAKIASVIYSTA